MRPEDWALVGAMLEQMAGDGMYPELYADFNPLDEELTKAWCVRFHRARRRELFVGATPLEATELAYTAAYKEAE